MDIAKICYMKNTEWLFFSFSISVKHQPFRVKIWRRLNALGAVQIKNTVYLLPANERHMEQLTWMAKETEDEGGEAMIISGGMLPLMSREQVMATFTRARDADYHTLEEEIRACLERDGRQEAELRKFSRKLEAARAIDFFPSGRGDVVEKLLSEAAKSPETKPAALPVLDIAAFQGKTWITRANPYVDRLASFWLVRRFIDAGARIAFLSPEEIFTPQPGQVGFDMRDSDFTHQEGRITFETLVDSFGVGERIPLRLRQVLRAIDLEEYDAAPPETLGVKQMLDGLVLTHPDYARIEQALSIFDALLASYTKKQHGEKE